MKLCKDSAGSLTTAAADAAAAAAVIAATVTIAATFCCDSFACQGQTVWMEHADSAQAWPLSST